MATKKSVPVIENPEVTEEVKAAEQTIDKDAEIERLKAELEEAKKQTKKETAKEPMPLPAEDEWEEYIDFVTPRHGRGQEKSFFVQVNGFNAQIPADGKMHHIRKPLALALLDSLEAEAQAEQFAEDLPHEAAPASFADLMNVINELRSKLRQSGIEV